MKSILSLAVMTALGVGMTPGAGSAAPEMHRMVASGAGWVATKTQASRLANAVDLGAIAPATKMGITVALTPRNLDGAKAYIKAEYTPGNAAFHHFLTPSSYTAAFGPTAASMSAVANYLASMGFTHITTTPNRTLVSGIGTAAIVERAFNTSIHAFNLKGALRYSNVSAAEVPAALASAVTSVLGLQDNPMSTFLTYPNGKKATRKFTPVQVSAMQKKEKAANLKPMSDTCELQGVSFCVESEFYTDDLEHYYDASSSQTASKTNIAIITAALTDQLVSDLRQNELVNGLRQVPVTVVAADPGYPSTQAVGADQLEFSMDTQTSTGIAGDAKGLYIYNVGDLTDQDISVADNKWVSDDVAPVASQSLGECEYNALTDGAMFAEDDIFIESMAQGQTMFASSGDGGSSCAFTFVTNGLVNVGLEMANYPASSTWVMGAGGTTPLANPDGSYYGEIAWAYSGGGLSLFEAPGFWTYGVQPGWIPDYDGLGGGGVPAPGVGAGNSRAVPDVSMDADGNFAPAIFYEYGGQQLNGGTSLASPLSAGSYARLESAANNQLGNAGPILYGHYKWAGGGWLGTSIECYGAALDGPPAPCIPGLPAPAQILPPTGSLNANIGGFNDVVYGVNGLYPALVGYDMTTGMGSFDLNAMQVSFGI